MTFSIRFATTDDLLQIQKIYNHEIINGVATCNAIPRDLDDYQNWFERLQEQGYPLFVIQEDINNRVVGFAEYSAFRHFSGYKHTVEHSVYISPEFFKKGLGKRLLEHLIAHAKAHHIKVMVAAIDHANLSSIQLHLKLGFVQTGYMPQVGQKFGEWRDLVLMQLNFNDH